MGYNDFIQTMFRMGFNWNDIEYYWRHQDELDELLTSDEELTEDEQKERDLNEYIANI